MKIDEVKKYFGSTYEFKKKTGMAHTNYLRWDRKGYIPILTQSKIEQLTGGELIARYCDGEKSKDVI